MILPALSQALQDRRLRPSDLRVYGVALELLDLGEFRALKARTVAHRLLLRRQHAASSLSRLTKLGYLEAADQLNGHTRTYRLRMSVQGLGRLDAA